MKKGNLILINVHASYVRLVHLKKGRMHQFHLDRNSAPSQAGAIYKARVIKRQAGLDACFVDLGLGKNSGFLYTGGKRTYDRSDQETSDRDKTGRQAENSSHEQNNPSLKQLRKGQSLMVQVVKDPLKGKNFRVSDKISLPGLYLVYLPNSPFHIGVSRQIKNEEVREKLVSYVQKWNGDCALIIRTRAELAREEDLKKEWDSLKNVWDGIKKKYQVKKPPGLIWSDVPFSFQILRDFLTEEVEQVLVDDEKMFSDLCGFMEKEMPREKHKISFYSSCKIPLFDKYNLTPALEQLLNKRIRLKSGGFIVIEETEAAVVVDVNTGSFMGGNSPEENILQLNLEAVKEITAQIRLRNSGGIILIDFIDMEEEKSRQQVMELLSQELEEDKVPTRLFPMSELGVVQLTRKRTRTSLLETLCKPCSYCDGLGWRKR